MSTDLTFITNEAGVSDRFGVLLGKNTRTLYDLTPEEIKIVEGAAK